MGTEPIASRGPMKCVSCGDRIQPVQLHQVCRRYRSGKLFEEVYRCALHYLVYDLTWTPGRGWHQGRVDRASYQGGTENYGQGYSWSDLPDGTITGASSCKSCGRLLDFDHDRVQMSVLTQGTQIRDVLFQCPRHW